MTSIIISHKLNEIKKVADQITILRDGGTVETLDCHKEEVGEDRIINGMVLLGFVVAVAFRTTVLARSTMIAALVLLRTVVAQQFVAGEAAGCRLALWPIPARSALALSCAIAAGLGVAATAASLGRAGLVGRNFSAGDGNLDAHQLFNIAQQPDFVRGAKGDRNTVAAVSGRAADTVDISVGHLRQVVVVDMVFLRRRSRRQRGRHPSSAGGKARRPEN